MRTYNKCPCGEEIPTTEELCEMCKLRKRLDEVCAENKRFSEAVRRLMRYAEYACEVAYLAEFDPEEVDADIDFAKETLGMGKEDVSN